MTHAAVRPSNRARLAEYVRACRERLTPETVGLERIGRRRTPGLRREEVAQLSGISIAYYSWLEQGREIHMSHDMLGALARALRLNEAEHTYLFLLAADEPLEALEEAPSSMHPVLETIFHTSDLVAAVKFDQWFNVIAATPLATAVFGLPPPESAFNLLDAVFAATPYRALWDDIQAEQLLMTAMFRMTLARWPDDPEGETRLARLRTVPAFERLWLTYEVRCRPSPKEYFRREPWRLRHPGVGELEMHRLAFSVPTALHREIVVYSAADDETFARLERLGTAAAR